MRWIVVVLGVVSFAACQDPLEIVPDEGAPDAAAGITPPVPTPNLIGCDRRWANGVDGDWSDPNMWNPVGVPVSSDSVCIDADGLYAVRIDQSPSILYLRVGGTGTQATVTYQNTNPIAPLSIRETLRVVAGSGFVLEGNGTTTLTVGSLWNDGTLSVTDRCGCMNAALVLIGSLFDDYDSVNNATIEFAGAALLAMSGAGTFTNNGSISVTAPHPVRFYLQFVVSGPPVLDLAAGSVTGTQSLFVEGPFFPHNARVLWRGGTLGSNAANPGHAVVAAERADIELRSTSLTGSLDVVGEQLGSTVITGDIGAGVDLKLSGPAGSRFRFTKSIGAPQTLLEGTLRVADTFGGFAGDAIELSFHSLLNAGSIEIEDGTIVEVAADSLINRGSIVAREDVRLTRASSILLNQGTIDVSGGTLQMSLSTTFDASRHGVMSGGIVLKAAALTGDGEVGDVVSQGGRIRPGARIGVLQAASVTMDATTRLEIEVAGTAADEHDQLAVAGQVAYAGTLAVTTVAPFVGGECGQILPIITDSSTGPRGAFDSFTGLAQSAAKRWRTHDPRSAYQLVGFNPIVDVHVAPRSLDVAEGGTPVTYSICLGPREPTNDVVVTAARVGTQIEAFPAVHTFGASDWMLPQSVTVIAINDGTDEGAHADQVTHAVTSSDATYDGASVVPIDVAIADNDGQAMAALTRNRRGWNPPWRSPFEPGGISQAVMAAELPESARVWRGRSTSS